MRVRLYVSFEAYECVFWSPYGLANMGLFGYLPVIVRDCTATYEFAETLDGLWKTRMAFLDVEARFGYSVASGALLEAVRSAD